MSLETGNVGRSVWSHLNRLRSRLSGQTPPTKGRELLLNLSLYRSGKFLEPRDWSHNSIDSMCPTATLWLSCGYISFNILSECSFIGRKFITIVGMNNALQQCLTTQSKIETPYSAGARMIYSSFISGVPRPVFPGDGDRKLFLLEIHTDIYRGFRNYGSR